MEIGKKVRGCRLGTIRVPIKSGFVRVYIRKSSGYSYDVRIYTDNSDPLTWDDVLYRSFHNVSDIKPACGLREWGDDMTEKIKCERFVPLLIEAMPDILYIHKINNL